MQIVLLMGCLLVRTFLLDTIKQRVIRSKQDAGARNKINVQHDSPVKFYGDVSQKPERKT